MSEDMLLYKNDGHSSVTATLNAATHFVTLTIDDSSVVFDPQKAKIIPRAKTDERNSVLIFDKSHAEGHRVEIASSVQEGQHIINTALEILARFRPHPRDSAPGARCRQRLMAQRDRRALGGPQPA